jgi:uncharacterized protein (UPF0262 family)
VHTDIFFVEEIWDTSLADQAVARAWRMGAKGQVQVETLIAKNTIEETMKDVEKESRERIIHQAVAKGGKRISGVQKEKEEASLSKTHTLLTNLRLITDYHHFANSNINNTPTNSNIRNSSTTLVDAARIGREGTHKRKREDEEDALLAAAPAAKSKAVRFSLM